MVICCNYPSASPSVLQHPHQVVTHFILGCLEVQNHLHGQKIPTLIYSPLNRNSRTVRKRNEKQVAKTGLLKPLPCIPNVFCVSFSPSESSARSFSSESVCAPQLLSNNSPILTLPCLLVPDFLAFTYMIIFMLEALFRTALIQKDRQTQI